jgi:aminoglycoside phosphotransferase (APT) family kinase protein
MIHEGRIAGVIDWEFAGSAHPARALARWEVSARAGLHARVNALRRGYVRRGRPDEAWVAAFAVAWALEVLGWRNPADPGKQARCVEVASRAISAPLLGE